MTILVTGGAEFIGSHYENNFYTKLQAKLDARKKLNISSGQESCPTLSVDLGGHLLTSISEAKLKTSVSHFCGNEKITWLDLAMPLFPNQEVLEWDGANSHAVRPKEVILKKQQ